MAKLDSRKLLKDVYSASTKAPSLIVVPPLTYFMVDGRGDPNTSADFPECVQALYALSYGLKFKLKQSDPDQDYVVMPLEGLWWADDVTDFTGGDRENWQWTLMIMQPPRLTAEQFDDLVAETARKKPLERLAKVRLETLDEGLAAQIMHIGPFSDEGPTVERLHEFIVASDCTPRGKHHEIYMSDPRRVPPEKWKTIIRQPCQKAE